MSKRDCLSPGELKRRVSTRLAWLQIRHKDFACSISMDKGLFSRLLRNPKVRWDLLCRIAAGLGVTPEELLDGENRGILVGDHPVLKPDQTSDERIAAIREHITLQSLPTWEKYGHKPEEERHQRRLDVRTALDNGTFSLETVKDFAAHYGVSTSQIYADRKLIIDLQSGQAGARVLSPKMDNDLPTEKGDSATLSVDTLEKTDSSS